MVMSYRKDAFRSRMRKNRTLDGRVREAIDYDARNPHPGGAHAWRRSTAGGDVELRFAGAASSSGPSPAPDASNGYDQ